MIKIKAIYQSESEDNNDIVFELESGNLLVKRSEAKVRKFAVNRWEEISFLSDDYSRINREPTEKELQAIKQFLADKHTSSDRERSLWSKIKARLNSFLN